LLGLGSVRIGAIVEADHDVRAQLELEADDPLRREVPLLSGRWLAKDDLVVADDAAAGVLTNEAPHLEPARVAEHRAIPVHESMDPAGRLNHSRARPAQKVERVDDDALDANGAQVLAGGSAHAGARGVGEERGHGERPAPGLERLSHAPGRE
jgi:hypothetical protein